MNNVGQQLVSHPVSLFLFFSSHFPLLPAVACLAEYATDLQFHWPSSTRFDFLFKKKRCGRCGRRIVRGGMPTPANEWAASFPPFFSDSKRALSVVTDENVENTESGMAGFFQSTPPPLHVPQKTVLQVAHDLSVGWWECRSRPGTDVHRCNSGNSSPQETRLRASSFRPPLLPPRISPPNG